MTLPGPPVTKAESERLLTAALIVGFAATALALLLFSWLGREILQGETLLFDERVRLTLHQHASPALTTLMKGLSLYAGPSWLTPLGILLALIFFLHGWHRGALLVVITISGAALLNGLLKLVFARPRPAAFFDYPLPASHSFPSGHAFFAASFFGGLAALVSGRIRSRPLQVGLWVICIVLALLVGVSRVYLGVHYPSDVMAGYAAAIVWVTAVAFGDRLVSHRRSRRTIG